MSIIFCDLINWKNRLFTGASVSLQLWSWRTNTRRSNTRQSQPKLPTRKSRWYWPPQTHPKLYRLSYCKPVVWCSILLSWSPAVFWYCSRPGSDVWSRKWWVIWSRLRQSIGMTGEERLGLKWHLSSWHLSYESIKGKKFGKNHMKPLIGTYSHTTPHFKVLFCSVVSRF